MRSTIDALRSLAKHLSLTLPMEWEVVIGGPNAGEFRPPQVRITMLEGGIAGPAGRNDFSRPFAIAMYLQGGDEYESWERLLAGYDAERAIIASFSGDAGTGIHGHKGRIPLWDWDGVGPDDDTDEREERDYFRATGFTSQVIPDGEDPRFVTVTASFTGSWSAAVGRWPSDTPLAGVGAVLVP